jgi:HTH-type transcriptional regulator, cell division transcriptional repressor
MAGQSPLSPIDDEDDDEGAGWYGEDVATFGDRLAAAREGAGLTQEDLSRGIGVRLETLQAWENDLSEPRANRMQMLAGMLGVSLTWLMVGKGDGLSGPPVEGQADQQDLARALGELRKLRVEMSRNLDRLGRLEGQLRRMTEARA